MALPTVPLMSRKKLLGAQEETTSGTSVLGSITTARADTVVYDARCEPVDMFSEGKRKPNNSFLGNIDAVPGRKVGRLTYREEIRYSAANGFLPVLTGAGMKLDTTYKPTSDMSSRKTWSLKLWEDGRWKGIYGAAANVRIVGTAGGRIFAEWEWMGLWQTVADASMPSGSAINSTPFLLQAATFTLGAATAPLVNAFELDLGNTVSPRESITDGTGVKHFYVESREPTLRIDTEAHKVADYDTYGKLETPTTEALNLVASDGTNSFTITAPRMQRITIGDSDRAGKLIDDLTYQCNASSGDDEVTITWAAP